MVGTRLYRDAKNSEVDYFKELCVCPRGYSGVIFYSAPQDSVVFMNIDPPSLLLDLVVDQC